MNRFTRMKELALTASLLLIVSLVFPFTSPTVVGQSSKGVVVGTITDPFGEFKEEVMAPETAFVIGLNNIPVINAGDALMHLGMDNFCKLDQPADD